MCKQRKLRLAALAAPLVYALAASAQAPAGAPAAAIEEVLVTARKVEESIQDTPVAVTAIGAGQIEDLGLLGLADIAKMTAGLIFDSEFTRGSNRPVIRGQANILGDSGVSYFIDGVYISGSIDDYDLTQVERVEVIKGPQSALYGRNTYAGAINIITRSPGEEFRARVHAEAASEGQSLVSASIGGPLGEGIGAGLAVRQFDLREPFTNSYDGSTIGAQQSRSFSGVLDFAPSDALSIRARAYVGDRDDGQPAVVSTRYFDNNCYTDNGSLYGGAGRYYCGVVAPRGIDTDWTVQVPDARDTDDNRQYSLVVDYRLSDAVSLTSITGMNDRTEVFVIDGDYLPTSFQVSNFTPNGFPYGGFADGPPFLYAFVGSMTDFTFASESVVDSFSQELQLSFAGERVSGLLGAYYFSQDETSRDIRNVSAAQRGLAAANFGAEVGRMQGVCAANPVCESMAPFFGPAVAVPRDVNMLSITNQAVFGLLGFDLGEAFGLTLEGRYQSEDTSQHAIIQDLGEEPEGEVSTDAEFSAFLPRVTLDWQVAEDRLVYLAVAEGTKPGGFNGTVAIEAGIPIYDEETATTVEIGVKNTLADGQLIANLALFRNTVEGYQLTQNVQSGANATSATVNAGDVDITGFEAEIAARPEAMPGLALTLNYAWVDPEFSAGADQNQGLLLDAADDGMVNCSTGKQFPNVESCTGNSKFGSIAGKLVPRTATHQVFADAELRRALGNGWEWYVGANYAYESSKFAQVHNEAETGETALLNLRLGFVGDTYAVRLWARNVTGEDTPYAVLRYAEPAAFRRNFAIGARRDAHYGVSLTANW